MENQEQPSKNSPKNTEGDKKELVMSFKLLDKQGKGSIDVEAVNNLLSKLDSQKNDQTTDSPDEKKSPRQGPEFPQIKEIVNGKTSINQEEYIKIINQIHDNKELLENCLTIAFSLFDRKK